MIKSGKMKLKMFVEGKTEKNYFSKLQIKNNVDISYTPIDMHGGGYSEFLKQIKKNSSDLGYLAVFIVIDLDRYLKEPGEREPFKQLYAFCKRKNRNGRIPYFLIVSNRSFEYFACLHCPSYKDTDTTKYIEKVFKFQDLDKFKSYERIYEFLNRGSRSFINAISKIKEKESFVQYSYEVKKNKLDIRIKLNKECLSEAACNYNHSNLHILFDIIGLNAE